MTQTKRICGCGCGREAEYLVRGTDLDGSKFTELCCYSSMSYLSECSHELGNACEVERLEDGEYGQLYFFGVWEVDVWGHYAYSEDGKHHLDMRNCIGPFDKIDCGYAPKELRGQDEGAAALHYKKHPATGKTWTILSFWDRSGDARDNSHSTFVIAQECSFAEMVDLIRERYPHLWNRFRVQPFLVYTGPKPGQSTA